jgi:hypothetical protein
VKAFLLVGFTLLAQLGPIGTPERAKQHVAYVAEAQTVAAGKRAVLELRFQVEDGFHVNSHTPKSEFLIPTALQLGGEGVKIAAIDYPVGKEFSFSFDPNEKLDVYSESFVVKVPVVAAAGPHELKGELKYQACDHAACFPPRTLPVDVLFTAK